MSKINWNSLVEVSNVPADLYTAIVTGRPDLIKDRELTKDEQLYVLQALRVLLDANKQLHNHSKRLAESVSSILSDVSKSLCTLYDFANFKADYDEDENNLTT